MIRYSRTHFERDRETFNADAYMVVGFGAMSFRVLGWHTEPDADTEWTGLEIRTGSVVVVAIGDDHRYTVEPTDISPLNDNDYCHVCGSVGCQHDGIDRTDDDDDETNDEPTPNTSDPDPTDSHDPRYDVRDDPDADARITPEFVARMNPIPSTTPTTTPKPRTRKPAKKRKA